MLNLKTEICHMLGIEYPVFAFTHCRDVAAAVCNAGGIGVLGIRPSFSCPQRFETHDTATECPFLQLASLFQRP